MKLYQKLLLGFACVALLVCCVGFVAQQMNGRIERSVVQLNEVAVGELNSAGDLSAAVRASLVAARRVATARTASEADAGREQLLEAFDGFERALASARSASTTGRSRAQMWNRPDEVERQVRKLAWLESAASGFATLRMEMEEALAASGGPRALQLLEGEIEPLAATLLNAPLQQYRDAARSDFAAHVHGVQDRLVQANRFLFVAVLLGIGMTLVLGILISNSIAGPLLVLTEATRTIGRGRLDHRVWLRSKDEVAELGTALNRMAERLGETTVSKHYLDNILTSMSDPLFVLDEGGLIVLANEAVAQTLGYEASDLIGQSIGVILCDGEDGASYILERVDCAEATGNVEMRFCTREGIELPVVFSGSLMRGSDGEVQGIVCVAKDITQQKLVEKELVRARERAEEMANLKSSFLANMSHEIRTPLTGIIGSAQVLGDTSGGEQREMAAIIERAGVRLLSTINSVLDMARIEAGELHPSFEVVNLAEEVRDAVDVLSRLAEAKGLALQIVEKTPGVHVRADVGFLNRIVTNLVGNAIKFTSEGRVTVEIEQEDELFAVVRVVDTGMGIASNFVPHLFDEFRQESSGLERRHEGTGLGLAITRRLVDLLDASISVKTEEGKGSTFEVRLQLAARPMRGVTAMPAAASEA